MSDGGDLTVLEDWVAGALANTSPAERRKLARQIAQDVRKSQVRRIGAQKNPDGSTFAPRKPSKSQQARGKKGFIKKKVELKGRRGAMFPKLRRAAFMKAQGTATEASVGFMQAIVARVARVHQLGLRDRVRRTPGAPEVDYPQRELLGVTEEDRDMILDRVIAHVQP